MMFDWLKRLPFGKGGNSASAADRPKPTAGRRTGMVTRTCKLCGKTFSLPEEVQHWPDCCQECRAKHRPAEIITRTCRECGRSFQFDASARQWPKYCQDCQLKRKGRR